MRRATLSAASAPSPSSSTPIVAIRTTVRSAGPYSAACGTVTTKDHPEAGARLKKAVPGTPASVVPSWYPSGAAAIFLISTSRTGWPTNFSGCALRATMTPRRSVMVVCQPAGSGCSATSFCIWPAKLAMVRNCTTSPLRRTGIWMAKLCGPRPAGGTYRSVTMVSSLPKRARHSRSTGSMDGSLEPKGSRVLMIWRPCRSDRMTAESVSFATLLAKPWKRSNWPSCSDGDEASARSTASRLAMSRSSASASARAVSCMLCRLNACSSV